MHAGVSYLSGITVRAQLHAAVGEEATAQARTEGDHDKVLHATSTTESILTKSHHMRVVSYGHSQSQPVAQQCRQGNDTFPREIRRVHDTALLIVRARRTDTHRTDGLVTAIGINHLDDAFTQLRHKSPYLRVLLCGETFFHQDVSSDIYNRIRCGLKTNINSNNSFLNRFLIHSNIFSYSATKIGTI